MKEIRLFKHETLLYNTSVTVANLIFHDIAPGFPGSCREVGNLRNSILFRRVQDGKVLTKLKDIIDNS